MILLSVIIPAFNEEKHIERCLRSISNQTFPRSNYEVIVVDDGSTDNTINVINRYFPEVVLQKNTSNQGLPNSLNIGINLSSSKYIVRLDADDFVSEQYLELLYLAISLNKKYKAVFCDYYLVDEDEIIISQEDSSINPIGCGSIISRDALVEIGLYNEEFKYLEEKELIIRFKKNFKILNLPLPLYRYRRHEGNITNDATEIKKYESKLKNI
tara:strand:- start:1358 stop:1996 length:639 start_codon:yes stop_codon:yes gene_type:complete